MMLVFAYLCPCLKVTIVRPLVIEGDVNNKIIHRLRYLPYLDCFSCDVVLVFSTRFMICLLKIIITYKESVKYKGELSYEVAYEKYFTPLS